MFRALLSITHTTIAEFFGDRGTQFAAALSFYAAFSLAPLLVMLLSVLALVLDTDASQARDFVISSIANGIGDQAASTIAGMLERARPSQRSGIAALLAFGAMLIGATAVIMSMKSALDHIFGGKDHESARELWIAILMARFKSFLMVLILAALIGVSLLLTALASGLNQAIGSSLPDWMDLATWTNVTIGALLLTALLYIFYRFFPDHPPAPRSALMGALLAVALLSLSKGIIGWYVERTSGAWAFGAAGALAVVLFWIFMSANIALLGAVSAKCIDRDWARLRANQEQEIPE